MIKIINSIIKIFKYYSEIIIIIIKLIWLIIIIIFKKNNQFKIIKIITSVAMGKGTNVSTNQTISFYLI